LAQLAPREWFSGEEQNSFQATQSEIALSGGAPALSFLA
jgi:hypothetical protein